MLCLQGFSGSTSAPKQLFSSHPALSSMAETAGSQKGSRKVYLVPLRASKSFLPLSAGHLSYQLKPAPALTCVFEKVPSDAAATVAAQFRMKARW
jgi:hypothetical protein